MIVYSVICLLLSNRARPLLKYPLVVCIFLKSELKIDYKGHSGAFVTIVDRPMSFTVSKRVNSKSADVVTAATIALLAPYEGAVLTITTDSGKELAYHEQMTKALGSVVYLQIHIVHGNED
jgi:hypothetical protein